ncbi:MAG: aminoacyl-histidine dipeptidase [Lachnospiraceae bacterium]|nr:aminoacyl-histidine dipeptidase [Lachnospiraceae bacterium]
MKSIHELEPVAVFKYFKELCDIPHGSGNTKAISDYCVEFAKRLNLEYVQDELGNVIISKPATPGRENDEGVIIQGHLDMVAVKDADSEHDFDKDALCLEIDGDMLYAKGTSLGGDDGIAVAYALAILESDTISHPALEAIFTVDEEIGLIGATALDMSSVKGKYLLNIDSEEEGVILVSCAGGLSGEIKLPVRRVDKNGICFKINIDGLQGGHSGTEIGKERCNAIMLMGRLLFDLHQKMEVSLVSFKGGEKDNAIAKDCEAVICIDAEDVPMLSEEMDALGALYANEYLTSDNGLKLALQRLEDDVVSMPCLDSISFEKLVFMLRQMPYGVMHNSMDIEGLVETSMNVGIASMLEDAYEFELTVSLRSSVNSRKAELNDKVRYLVEFLGGDYTVHGEYPSWPYRHESVLRPKMVEVYKELFDKEPEVQAIHAGLECGILLEKCPRLDAVSFGPDILDIHTTKERLSISSVERNWKYLVELLNKIK